VLLGTVLTTASSSSGKRWALHQEAALETQDGAPLRQELRPLSRGVAEAFARPHDSLVRRRHVCMRLLRGSLQLGVNSADLGPIARFVCLRSADPFIWPFIPYW